MPLGMSPMETTILNTLAIMMTALIFMPSMLARGDMLVIRLRTSWTNINSAPTGLMASEHNQRQGRFFLIFHIIAVTLGVDMARHMEARHRVAGLRLLLLPV